MKKLLILAILLLSSFLFAESYIISDCEFQIEGKGFLGTTKEYSIITKYPVDKKTVFSSSELLESYISDYRLKLESSRAFAYVDIGYETLLESSDNPVKVILKVNVEDSNHLLALPYGKYSSNSGLSIKLKAKDTNFLGSLNTLSTDLSLSYTDENFVPGFTFAFDLPFKMFNFDATWVNDYTVTYTIGDSTPEWNAKTGLKLVLPSDKKSFVFEFYQYFIKDFEYLRFNDEMYFKEEAIFSVPFNIYNFSNYSTLFYTPHIGLNFNWDLDNINAENDDLSGPTITIGHTLQNESIIWENHFRKGYKFQITNDFIYNFQRNEYVPYLEAEGLFFENYELYPQDYWNRYGICLDLYAFTYIDLPFNKYNYGNKIGSRLRGVLDSTYLGNEKPEYTTSSAIVLNIDLPHNILTTDFSQQIINFNLQMSPFFDIAFILDRNTQRLFHPFDAQYCAGLEFLVNPLKWTSYTLRISLGVDLKEALKENNFLEGISNHKELFIGIGLHY